MIFTIKAKSSTLEENPKKMENLVFFSPSLNALHIW
jgi:hypothetical protein